MAIKISGTTVIDDGRKFIPLSIEANSTVGTAGSLLASTGTGIQWVPVTGTSKGFVYFAAATV
jgi:hypothetical protein